MSNQTAIIEHAPKWREYYELCKPKVVVLIIFTAVVGMLLAVPGVLPLGKVIFATLGIGPAVALGAGVYT